MFNIVLSIAMFNAKGSLLNCNLYWDTVYIRRDQILYYQNKICDKDNNIKRVLFVKNHGIVSNQQRRGKHKKVRIQLEIGRPVDSRCE